MVNTSAQPAHATQTQSTPGVVCLVFALHVLGPLLSPLTMERVVPSSTCWTFHWTKLIGPVKHYFHPTIINEMVCTYCMPLFKPCGIVFINSEYAQAPTRAPVSFCLRAQRNISTTSSNILLCGLPMRHSSHSFQSSVMYSFHRSTMILPEKSTCTGIYQIIIVLYYSSACCLLYYN